MSENEKDQDLDKNQKTEVKVNSNYNLLTVLLIACVVVNSTMLVKTFNTTSQKLNLLYTNLSSQISEIERSPSNIPNLDDLVTNETQQELDHSYGIPVENSILAQIPKDVLISKINDKQTFMLYLGNPNCGACEHFVPMANDLLKSYGLDKLYYVDFNYKDVDMLDSLAYEKLFGYYQGTPLFITYVNGEPIANNQQLIEVDGLSFEASLKELYNVYAGK